MTFLITALFGAIMNRIRGSVPGGDWLIGLAYADMLLYLGYSPLISFGSGLILSIVFRPGWGRYIGFMGGIKGNWATHMPREEIRWIDRLLACFMLPDRAWGAWGMLLRGVYFIPAVTIPCGWFSPLIAPVFVISYFVGISVQQIVLKGNSFTWAEYLFGALMFGMVPLWQSIS